MLRLLGGINKADGAEQKACVGRQRGPVRQGSSPESGAMVGESAGAVNDLRGGGLWTEGPRTTMEARLARSRDANPFLLPRCETACGSSAFPEHAPLSSVRRRISCIPGTRPGGPASSHVARLSDDFERQHLDGATGDQLCLLGVQLEEVSFLKV